MPPIRRSNLSRRSRNAQRLRTVRTNETPEERSMRNAHNRANMSELRETLSQEQRAVVQTRDRKRQQRNRNQQSVQINANRQRRRNAVNVELERVAFQYDCTIDYSELPCVSIGAMTVVCPHCYALKFPSETPGLCCMSGKVKLPPLPDPPEPLRSLIYDNTPQSRQFLTRAQQYNSCFQMTSFGAEVIQDNRPYNPTFKIQGQIHHRYGSLLPTTNEDHKFLQIYFIGNVDKEIDMRSAIHQNMQKDIIRILQNVLHEHNAYVRQFKTALDTDLHSDDHQIVISAGAHARQFNIPTVDEIAIIYVGDPVGSRDIVLKRRNNGELQRVSEIHPSYDALQYPIMFWRGDDGYHINIKMFNTLNGEVSNKKVSSMNYYAYRLMIRAVDNYLLRLRRLLQQYIVDMYVKIETERLTFIRFNQTKLRSEEYIHLRDAISSDGNAADIGRVTILPATYIGSPRHMHEYAQDAMTYVRNYGRPDLFITFTCNPKWKEITQLLHPGQTSSDRHDIVARVFKQKQMVLINLITKQKIFGAVKCWMYSVEWQKRGLPHSHMRPLVSDTITGNDGYPLYRRRSPADNGKTFTMNVRGASFAVDNSWIVPYSPFLSKVLKTHINVEVCCSIKSIKYVCEYVNKGSDMAVFGIQAPDNHDEVLRYQLGRYVNCNEAVWRIFSFPVHERTPTVVHLAVHLENGQRVYYTAANAAQRAELPPATTLTNFFDTCRSDEFARTLLYSEMPRYFTWNASSKKFQRRKQGETVVGFPGVYASDALGRIYTVHPKNDECFYLRMVLLNVRGPTSFESLRTVDGILCATYREACQRMQLLENDNHWDLTLADATMTAPANQLRTLFAIIISTCFPSNPTDLWNKYKNDMTDDILHRIRTVTSDNQLEMSDEMRNETLILIEDMCLLMSGNLLCKLGMPSPNQAVQINVPLLNPEQNQVYDEIMQAVDNGNGGFFFLDAPGETGKTFLISLILATIRSRSDIALALASSGIAATLLDGGRTAHSALKLPLNMQVDEEPICNISKNSAMAKVLQQCKIIVWDECTMAHKRALEALNRTLKDLRNDTRHFGGALILLSGDFRQTLPVIPRSTPADELNACLKASALWKYVKKLQLKTNMRVALRSDQSAEEFSRQLLAMGNGVIPVELVTGLIEFPQNFCSITTTPEELIMKVFPNIAQNYVDHDWLSARAILAAKNKDVDHLNFVIQNDISGELHSYKSVDSVMDENEVTNYPTEFLNSLDVPGLPPHILKLKVGSIIILLRNLNAPKLCNGTRLIVKTLKSNVIQAMILRGKFKGEDVLIPRIPLIANDLPFVFKRLQIPVRLAFAMTINKAQGQSLDVCGINLEFPCFSHGQLYVACSRVGKPSALYVYAPENKTKNVVYHKALQ